MSDAFIHHNITTSTGSSIKTGTFVGSNDRKMTVSAFSGAKHFMFTLIDGGYLGISSINQIFGGYYNGSTLTINMSNCSSSGIDYAEIDTATFTSSSGTMDSGNNARCFFDDDCTYRYVIW